MRLTIVPHILRRHRVRTPTVLQMEAVECGAAVLGIVLGYYGRFVPLAELRRECGVSRDGSTAANILKAAQRYGLCAQSFAMDLETLQALRRPVIVFWNFNHFVVVEGFSGGGKVYINDTATGPRTVALTEFDHAFTGVVLVMEPGPNFTLGGQPPSTLRGVYMRLRGCGDVLTYCVLAGFLLVVPGLAVSMLFQVFVDQVLLAGQQDWLRPLLLGLGLSAACRGGLQYLQLRALRRWQLKLAAVLSSTFLWHLLRLPSSFYAQRYAGEISQRLALNDKVATVLSGRLATTVIEACMMLVYASVMLCYDVLLTGIGLTGAALQIAALQWLARRRVDANLLALQEEGKLSGLSMVGLRNIETLKAAALESDFFARWAGTYARAVNAQQACMPRTRCSGSCLPF